MKRAGDNDGAMLDESDSDERNGVSGEESHDSTDERMDLLRKELADVPFEDLNEMDALLRQAKSKESTSGTTVDKKTLTKKKGKEMEKSDLFAENRKKKDSRPLEMSSKQRPSKFRKVVAGGSKMTRDPRFDDLSGTLNHELFKKSYAFLNEIKDKEKKRKSTARKEVRRRLKREQNAEKKAILHKLLQKLEQNEKKEKEDECRKEKHREIKKKEMDAIKQGKRPFFLKKSEKKKLELAEKYKTLKSDGKLEKYLSKKRKRNAAKDRRHLPKVRTQNS